MTADGAGAVGWGWVLGDLTSHAKGMDLSSESNQKPSMALGRSDIMTECYEERLGRENMKRLFQDSRREMRVA